MREELIWDLPLLAHLAEAIGQRLNPMPAVGEHECVLAGQRLQQVGGDLLFGPNRLVLAVRGASLRPRLDVATHLHADTSMLALALNEPDHLASTRSQEV